MSKKCPKCNSEMKKGLIVGRGHGWTAYHPEWAEKIEFLGFGNKSGEKVHSFRCERCGFIEQYTDDYKHFAHIT